MRVYQLHLISVHFQVNEHNVYIYLYTYVVLCTPIIHTSNQCYNVLTTLPCLASPAFYRGVCFCGTFAAGWTHSAAPSSCRRLVRPRGTCITGHLTCTTANRRQDNFKHYVINPLDPGTAATGRIQDLVFEKFLAINYCTEHFQMLTQPSGYSLQQHQLVTCMGCLIENLYSHRFLQIC